MRRLSHSALRMWERDREEFYLCYLAPTRLQRSAQMQAAAIGSAFDAQVKTHIASDLYGWVDESDLFTSQVDPLHQEWAKGASEYVFNAYVLSGRYHALLEMLANADDVELESEKESELGGVPVVGFPDLTFLTKSGYRCVLDWKVKGFASKTAKSPTKHYVMCSDGFEAVKPSRNNGKAHKHAVVEQLDGVTYHKGYMEQADSYYADQLALYLFLLGETPGCEKHLVMIDELVSKPSPGTYPTIRVASLCSQVSAAHQLGLIERLQTCWGEIASGHIFTDMSPEESKAKCESLDMVGLSQSTKGGVGDAEFSEFMRSQFMYG